MAQSGPSIGQARAEAYNGPKARVAVSEFEDKMSSAGQYRAEYGRGMADMLSDSLFHSGRYIVLERQKLQAVMAEQNLGASGRVKKETAAQVGELEGAELLVTAAITGFDPGSSGGNVSGSPLSSVLKGSAGNLISQLSGGVNTARIAADIRLIDTNTGRVVASTNVNATATSYTGMIGSSMGSGLGAYSNTPMETAIREMIQRAVDFVVTQTPANYYHGVSQ